MTNRPAGGRYVDCRWVEERLTVELDGYRYHSSRHAWELDRRREREAYARGDEFRRYTYGDVFEQPAPMLARTASRPVLVVVRRPPIQDSTLQPRQSRAAGSGSGSRSADVRSARSARLASMSGSRASAISEATMPTVKAAATMPSEATGPIL